MAEQPVQATTPPPRWKWHDETFASLMLGRVQLAQISRGSSRHWSWTLFFCDRGERPTYSSEDKGEAMAVAEDHARKVLAA
jgi:hypothetical protein